MKKNSYKRICLYLIVLTTIITLFAVPASAHSTPSQGKMICDECGEEMKKCEVTKDCDTYICPNDTAGQKDHLQQHLREAKILVGILDIAFVVLFVVFVVELIYILKNGGTSIAIILVTIFILACYIAIEKLMITRIIELNHMLEAITS